MTREGLKRQLGDVAKAALHKWEVDSRNTASGEYRDRAVAVGDAILAAIEAAGVRLVPSEATEEMAIAAIQRPHRRYMSTYELYTDVFDTMSAASPYAPAQKDESHD